MKATEHGVDFKPDIRLVRSMPYRPGPALREHTKRGIDKMLAAGFTEPATSKCPSPVFFVSKREGTSRLCVDYRRLNTKALSDIYPLPRIEYWVEFCQDAGVFSKLD